MSTPPHPSASMLASATQGFDLLFANDVDGSLKHFQSRDDPFHLMGRGVIAFLEAALGMETNQLTNASRDLALSETGTRKQMKAPKAKTHSRFPAGLEWDIINADAVVLLGLVHALSETYMGYLQCMYSLNNAHSKFTKLYKTVFPNGIDEYILKTEAERSGVSPLVEGSSLSSSPGALSSSTSLSSSSSSTPPAAVTSPTSTPTSSTLQVPTPLHHKPSQSSLASVSSTGSTTTLPPSAAPSPTPAGTTKSFFGRWLGSSGAAASSEPSLIHPHHEHAHGPHVHGEKYVDVDGPVEELIVAGTAFGYGLFNLVFSLLPKKVQSLVGFLGFQHDRKLALKALTLSAEKKDVHGVFSGLVLMTYYGVVLLLSGWQASTPSLLSQVERIIDRVEERYPDGALWVLNRAKLLRMSARPLDAIAVLKNGLRPDRGSNHSFKQADMMLLFELAWTLLSQRHYAEAASSFLKIIDLNTWSHATYLFLAAGCNFSLGKLDECQVLLDRIPALLDAAKKVGGKDLPTEVFIRKKLQFYKDKQKRRGGDPERYAESIRISPAEELGIFWNTHAHVSPEICRAHIRDVVRLTPAVTIRSRVVDEILAEATSGSGTTGAVKAKSEEKVAGDMSDAMSMKSSKSAKSVKSFLSRKSSSKKGPVVYDGGQADFSLDLDTPDELAVRSLLMGICLRGVGDWEGSRAFLEQAKEYQVKGVKASEYATGKGVEGKVGVNTWVGGVAMFEMAVLELKEVEGQVSGVFSVQEKEKEKAAINEKISTTAAAAATSVTKEQWLAALHKASVHLDEASALSPTAVDLSGRLDSRISMLRDEIFGKREALGR